MNTVKIIKTRCFSLTTQPEQIDHIKSEITQFPGVKSVDFKQGKLIVSYDLNKCQHVKLQLFIAGLISLKPESFPDKLLSSLILFTEQNELDHAQIPTGWGYYVQNLYLSLHKDNQHY